MKNQIRKEFVIDLSNEAERSRLFSDIQDRSDRDDMFKTLIAADHVEVLFHEGSGRFVVRLKYIGPALIAESLNWLDSLSDALIYACLFTTTQSLEDFICAFGTVHLEKFVC